MTAQPTRYSVGAQNACVALVYVIAAVGCVLTETVGVTWGIGWTALSCAVLAWGIAWRNREEKPE